MSHLTWKEVILEYLAEHLDNSLGPEAVADLERHLAECRPCLAYLKTYGTIRDLTR